MDTDRGLFSKLTANRDSIDSVRIRPTFAKSIAERHGLATSKGL
jgi:hypothetical protein